MTKSGHVLYDKIDFYVEAIGGCNLPAADFDGDNDIDQSDFAFLQACIVGSDQGVPEGCDCADLDGDGLDIDQSDYNEFELCSTGPEVKLDPNDTANWPAGCGGYNLP